MARRRAPSDVEVDAWPRGGGDDKRLRGGKRDAGFLTACREQHTRVFRLSLRDDRHHERAGRVAAALGQRAFEVHAEHVEDFMGRDTEGGFHGGVKRRFRDTDAEFDVILPERTGQALPSGRGQIGNTVEQLIQATVEFVHDRGTLRLACGIVGRCRSTGNGVKIGENAGPAIVGIRP